MAWLLTLCMYEEDTLARLAKDKRMSSFSAIKFSKQPSPSCEYQDELGKNKHVHM